MKKILLPFSIALLAISLDSCNLDTLDKPAILSTPPVIKITGPTTVNAGAATDLVAIASDGKVSPIKSATIRLFTGSTTISTNTSTTVDANGAITLKIAGSVMAGLLPGGYKLTVTAVDAQEQAATPVTVDVAVTCSPLASCVVAGKLTVILLVPSNTPANASVGLVGESTGWGGNPDLAMTKIATGCYCVASGVTNASDKDEFKFRLDSDWGKEMLKDDCTPPDNLKYTGTDLSKAVTYTVAKWKTLCP